MSNVFKVKATSDLPEASAKWTVNVDAGTPEQQLVYMNLAYDLIAVAMGKLGLAMSDWILGDDSKMKALQKDVEDR
jgi:hypothetical protein